jgi:hypothetical protein
VSASPDTNALRTKVERWFCDLMMLLFFSGVHSGQSTVSSMYLPFAYVLIGQSVPDNLPSLLQSGSNGNG